VCGLRDSEIEITEKKKQQQQQQKGMIFDVSMLVLQTGSHDTS
jgi:hypothetical protein